MDLPVVLINLEISNRTALYALACYVNADCWASHSDAGVCVVVQGNANCYCSTNNFGYALNQTTQMCDLRKFSF